MSEHKKALKHLDFLISVLESEDAAIGVDDEKGTLQLKNPLVKPLNVLERKKTFEQLKLLILRFCFTPSHSDELAAVPLEELPNIFLLLAELVAEAKASEKNRKEKKKLLHLATLLLRHMLQMPSASYYRTLGLNDGASLAQIEKHYQLLCKLFWFDGDFDPKRKSRARISTAYAVLKDPRLRLQYNNQLARQSLLVTPRRRVQRKNSQWSYAAVAMLVVFGLAGTMFYNKNMETDVTSSLQFRNTPPVASGGESSTQPSVVGLVDTQVVVPEPEQTGHIPVLASVPDQKTVSRKVPQNSDIAPVSVVSEEVERPLLNDSNPKEKALVRQEAAPSIIPTRDNVVVDVLPKLESLPLTDASSVKNEDELAALLAELASIGSPVAEDVLSRVESHPLGGTSLMKSEDELAVLLAEPVLVESPVEEDVLPEVESHPLGGTSLKNQIEQAALPATSVHDSPIASVPPESESSSLVTLSLKDRIEKATLPSFSARD